MWIITVEIWIIGWMIVVGALAEDEISTSRESKRPPEIGYTVVVALLAVALWPCYFGALLSSLNRSR